ncbi:asparagine synthase-related protein [uncultured Flavobacterium sp.]|uniref:asparagine synthase-related protein n=1 Tax=uncultured Flavobacterium sp. TaxID=165435 RepID=UPI0030ECBE45|tara:strand:- start:14523 stop:15905 length:1383 start_codon:yes stop_codon:yes gene_type:complete
MHSIKNKIIPSEPIFVGEKKMLDYEAICVFVATGFFLDDDTYFKELKVLKPATNYSVEKDKIVAEESYFKWHYSPVDRPLKQIVQEFSVLFEAIIKEQVQNNTVILPLSGGLDSRTQAAALHHLGNKVNAYSYEFYNGHNETSYSEKIAKACGFSFQKWQVNGGYLWNEIENLAQKNQCYSEFTHPRQMAFVEKYAAMGDVFSLGHWGDVLFDDMHVKDHMSNEQQVEILLKKVIKKGGLELANVLWKSWGLEGDFEGYLKNRIRILLDKIDIKTSANAQIRAFKSLYWAPRWTSTNLSVFESVRSISLPYYDNRMCEFICSVPEKYLAGRQIQIEYLKLRMPSLARITWQDHRPFNLYNYKNNRFPYNLPFRVLDKLKRLVSNKKFIQRNWELQFMGKNNEVELEKWLFENESFKALLNPEIVKEYYSNFKNKDSVYYSHDVSMLLTLSLFTKLNNYEK